MCMYIKITSHREDLSRLSRPKNADKLPNRANLPYNLRYIVHPRYDTHARLNLAA